jgi:hypothetical protein
MPGHRRRIGCFGFALWLLPLGATAASGRIPVSFEPNAGQTDSRVRFLLRARLGTFFFTPSEVVLAPSASQDAVAAAPLRVRFVDANPDPRIEGGVLRSARVNYLVGRDSRGWHTALPTYGEIRYAELYPGVALAYSADGRPLKGTYTLMPGADPARIRWRYEGASARLDDGGRLQIQMAGGGAALTEDAPIAWQEIEGQRVPVAAHYVIHPDGSVAFRVGEPDPVRPLTNDTVLTY